MSEIKGYTFDQIIIDAHTREFRPTELYHLPSGAIGDNPSFAMLLERPGFDSVLGQFSLETIKKAFNDLGYDIQPINQK